MNILLWVIQALLAAAFLAHGLLLLMPPAEIAAQMYASLPRAVLAVFGRGGSGGRYRHHAAWCDAYPAVARASRCGRHHVCDGVSHDLARRPRRNQLRSHHAGAAGHGDVRDLYALAGASDSLAIGGRQRLGPSFRILYGRARWNWTSSNILTKTRAVQVNPLSTDRGDASGSRNFVGVHEGSLYRERSKRSAGSGQCPAHR